MAMNVARYIVLRRIATSGRAETLLAFQGGLAGLEKLVVIKRLLPAVAADEAFRQAFLGGARRALGLRHPHLVELYEVDDQSEPCVVMEYLAGEDLGYVINRLHPNDLTIPVGVACRIVAQLAEALHAAHSAVDVAGQNLEMLHLGIHPSNIVVGYTGTAKLLDLGLASIDRFDAYGAAGGLHSTLAYRSPESLEQRALDARSDVYSLGVVCYELLAQRRLFGGDSAAALREAVLEMPVPSIGSARAEVSAGLDELVRTAMHRDPDQRPSSMQEFRQRLEECLTSSKIYTGDAHVAEWMQTALALRWTERQAVERSAIAEARQRTNTAAPLAVEVPLRLASAMPGDGDLPLLHTGSGGQLVLPTLERFSGPPSQPARRRNWVFLGAVSGLSIVALLGLAFWIGLTPDQRMDSAQGSSRVSGDSVEVVSSEDPQTLCRVARAQYDSGESEAALQTLRRARQLASPASQREIAELEARIRPSMRLAVIKRFVEEGNLFVARRELEVLLREYPRHNEARTLLLSLASRATDASAALGHGVDEAAGRRGEDRTSGRRPSRRPHGKDRRTGGNSDPRSARHLAGDMNPNGRNSNDEPEPNPSAEGFGIDAELTDEAPPSPPQRAPAQRVPAPRDSPAPTPSLGSSSGSSSSRSSPKAPARVSTPGTPGQAAIRVISEVRGVVSVNGNSLNKNTPVKLLLDPGTYEISVRLDGLDVEIKREVTVTAGKTVTLRLKAPSKSNR